MSSSSSVSLSSMLSSWQRLDLQNLQLSLDEQASQVVDLREGSHARRVSLAALTKEFKRSDAGTDPAPLLKKFREEVDLLTDRAKFAESAFLTVYKRLRSLHDPCDALDSAARQCFEEEQHRARLLQEKNEEIASLRAQLAQEQKKEQEPEQQESNRSMNDEFMEQQFEQRLEEKLEEARARAEEEQANMSSQLELAQIELERQTEEISSLKHKLSAQERHKGPSIMEHALGEENASLVKELNGALNRLKLQNIEFDRSRESFEASQKASEEQLQSKDEEIHLLRKRLANAVPKKEHDDLITKLKLLEHEFHENDDDDDEVGDALERFFMKNNKHLKGELIVWKRRASDLEEEVRSLKAKQQKLQEALEDQRDLASTLETDVSLMQNHESQDKMVDALCRQRDRLRVQLEEKEEELEAHRRKVIDRDRKLQTLQEDNVQLFQRIRFLQNFKASERSTLITDLETGDQPSQPKVTGLGKGVEHQFRDFYKESEIDISPRFERLVLKTCNPFLSRSRGRLFLAAHQILIHLALLVLLVLQLEPKGNQNGTHSQN